MAATTTSIALIGARSVRNSTTATRIRWAIFFLLAIFAIVAFRLVQLANVATETTIEGEERSIITASRPALLDRNGLALAVDIRVPSLFAEPRRIVDVDEATEKLVEVLPDLDRDWLRGRLSGEKGFVWVKRELTPAIQERIMQLGIPGLDFLTESKRFYPGGPEVSHLIGTVNIDSQGIAGIERNVDLRDVALLQSVGLARGQELSPVSLAIDLRVQHALRAELLDALTRYQAIAAAGVILNAKTGEVVALVSLPDFDPNKPASALVDGRMNRITAGAFELGSVFKTVAFAAALDSGKVKLTDSFDTRFGIRFGRFTIDDFHGQNRILTVPEIYQYSSNVGAIQMVQALGKDEYRAFLSRLGFDAPLVTELPERALPNVPDRFSEVQAATAAFGHGLSITPLHLAAAMAAFVNGGNYVPPTFYPRTEEKARPLYRPVISRATSDRIRYLMRFNALEGSGSRMNAIANGYRAGGKTGTAEKVVDGRYSSDANLNSFAAAFPMEDPRYVMVILIDEPKAETPQSGTTAGWNAGEVTGRIIQRAAPMLGIPPSFDGSVDQALFPEELRSDLDEAKSRDAVN
jgi:cell division protein FtsI (penicillin-binding protein 3)